jgi:hypothetical protein
VRVAFAQDLQDEIGGKNCRIITSSTTGFVSLQNLQVKRISCTGAGSGVFFAILVGFADFALISDLFLLTLADLGRDFINVYFLYPGC